MTVKNDSMIFFSAGVNSVLLVVVRVSSLLVVREDVSSKYRLLLVPYSIRN